ncbi:hypothetical protein [Mesoplasma melaleucae]|uniref:Transmembrane protein n=1 Tax=Mesoplasma melaleucae TaxID=81459 RepID=A0A2K8NVE1_9MOLU|nr:hypothetical protein [Mesoplasma melaleucae]ATZ17815.1 hypothetical protein EMELA_v1c02420 [Mesoplasma melaleucae]
MTLYASDGTIDWTQLMGLINNLFGSFLMIVGFAVAAFSIWAIVRVGAKIIALSNDEDADSSAKKKMLVQLGWIVFGLIISLGAGLFGTVIVATGMQLFQPPEIPIP